MVSMLFFVNDISMVIFLLLLRDKNAACGIRRYIKHAKNTYEIM